MDENTFSKHRTSSPIFLVGMLLFLIALVAWYAYVHRPCAEPITYRIGSFDTNFGISQKDFLADAAEAATIWNTAEGRTLLAYSANGTMPINLVYDSRQQLTQTADAITQKQSVNEATKAKLDAMEAQYATDQQQYESAKQSFETRSAQYDAGVQKVNASGGASPSQADELDAERASLEHDQTALNAQADSLNQEQSELNLETNSLNAAIQSSNSEANAVNTQAGQSFEEGEYVNQNGATHIDIYQFQSHTQLVRLIAHEMGHSLGLEHDTNTESIMYPYNVGTTLALSTEDHAELTAECTFPSNEWQTLLSLMK